MIKLLGRGGLYLLSATLIVFVLAVIMAQGFVLWLNTKGGGDWLGRQIERALDGRPYNVVIKDLHLSGLFSIRAGETTLSDSAGTFGAVEDLMIGVNPLSLLIQHLSVNIFAREITLQRMPQGGGMEREEDDKEQGFYLSEVPFSSVVLAVKFQKLSLGEAIIKDGLETRITTRHKLSLNGAEALLSGEISFEHDKTYVISAALPVNLRHDVMLNEDAQRVDLQLLLKQMTGDEIAVRGTYDMAPQRFDMEVEGQWSAAKIPDIDPAGPITVRAQVAGVVKHFTGDVLVSAADETFPVSLTAHIERHGDSIHLAPLEGRFKDNTMSGDVRYDLSGRAATGEVTGDFKDFTDFEILTGQSVSGHGTMTVGLFPGAERKQGVRLNAAAQNLGHKGIKVQSAAVEAEISDISDWRAMQAELSLDNLQHGTTTIKTVQASTRFVEEEGQVYMALAVKGHGINHKPFNFDADAHVHAVSPPVIDIVGAKVAFGSGKIDLSGHAAPEALELNVDAQGIRASEVPFMNMRDLPVALNELNAVVIGTYGAPIIEASYILAPAGDRNKLQTQITGDVAYQTDRLQANVRIEGKGVEAFSAQAAVPMTLSLYPFAFEMQAAAPLNGAVAGRLDLAALAPFVPEGRFDISGKVNVDASLSGTISSPVSEGDITLRKGVFEDRLHDLYLSDITSDIAFTDQNLTVRTLSAQDRTGTGTLSGTGTVILQNMQHPDVTAEITLTNMALMQSAQYGVHLNADIGIKTRGQTYKVRGHITPEHIEINLPQRFKESVPELNIVRAENKNSRDNSLAARIMLDILFEAQNRIFVRGWGLDTELGGKLNITGSADKPLVNGQLETIRGRYEEFGKRFDIDHARLRFQGSVPPSPYLDVKTSTQLDEIVGHILIGGRAAAPDLTFSSTPSLPSDEVLSRILFGKDISQISPFQAVQLVRTLRKFSGKSMGPDIDVLGTLRDVTGLDDIRVEGLGTEDAKVGAGKYIADGVYLEVERGAGESSGAASVEIEVTPHVNVESTTSQTGDSDLGLFWEWDY